MWDITFLARSNVVGAFFYLYAIPDLRSRKIVAWEVHEREAGELAAELVEKAAWREHLRRRPLILHADNGAAPSAYTLKAKLEALGIRPSYSRPGVSDDNAHMEAWFRTARYRPSYPSKGFADIESARAWALKLVSWYNGEHRHSAIGFVTPAQNMWAMLPHCSPLANACTRPHEHAIHVGGHELRADGRTPSTCG